MNMNMKIVALALTSVVSGSVLAATATYQATVDAYAEPILTETTALHFGAMKPTAGSVCTMDNAGAVTGDCNAAHVSIALGVITVSGVDPDTGFDVTVTGSPGASTTFVSTVDITGGTAPATAVADTTLTAITTDGVGADLVINVYGSMTVDTLLTSGATFTAGYAVDVVFN
jgi:hypothetical protein